MLCCSYSVFSFCVSLYVFVLCLFFFFFKQKTAYEMRISDWSSDVCSSDLAMAKDKAIIISTHILEEVEAVCSRAIIIARGRVVAEGRPDPASGGWRIGDIIAEPGRMDAAFRQVTQAGAPARAA